ncbi:invasion associated locus B family protein [Bartonella sp. A05]|uniref:invasion associated locus B family protein n=1 Tax=Bartonella sp. A05 TaxID=2967261 RepID=UPI0022A8E920|nr:invasion associated locus B family protein [Bartonella sp. A05]MCZ2203877.1 invasion associated locus B family protein [Bartonella sp. A05]
MMIWIKPSVTLHQFLKRTYFTGVIIYVLYSIFAHHTIAQTSNAHNIPAPQTYGAWTKVCSLPPGTPNLQCEIVQNVQAQNRRDITFRVAFYKLPKNQGVLMRVSVPIRVELRPGIGIKVDNKDIGKIEYRRCLSDTCIAETLLTEDMLKPFFKGKEATYFIFITPEQGVGAIVDLNDFSTAYAALST